VDVSYDANPQFLRNVVIAFIVYPFVYTLVLGLVARTTGYNLESTSCIPITDAPSIIGICQCFVMICILVFFLVLSLRHPLYTLVGDKDAPPQQVYIWNVLANTRHPDDSSHNRRAWICIRFVLAIFCQAGARIAFNSYYLLLTQNPDPAQKLAGSWESSVLVFVCYDLNALVVFWSNRGLQKWLAGVFGFSVSDDSSDRDKSGEKKEYPMVEISASSTPQDTLPV